METGLENIRYLTGFTGSNAFVVYGVSRGVLITDPRYTSQAREEVKKSGFSVRIYKKDLFPFISAIIEKVAPEGSVGLDGGTVTHDFYKRLRTALRPRRLRDVGDLVAGLRRVKEDGEIALIRRSAAILESGFRKAARLLRPGAVEKAVARKVEDYFIGRGAEGVSFESIVASGPRGALPHGKASHKGIRKGELVVVDMGARFEGYCSDATRTFCVGRATRLQKKIYAIVKEAQLLAAGRIRDGVRASVVDRAARSHIRKAGYGRNFGHGTGHGLGLAVHEGPGLGPRSADVLAQGMVVTVEPGIYIPGWGGVRIEDMVVVRRDGCEFLTTSPERLISL